ncbi:T9SS type A sorting domain-containing protein, partial [Flavihumibacter sp. R14]|nr:T9SS type A sorting domain-containing protein [Flavihumibacter soli]
TPYTSSSGGTAGTPLTISFSVINQPNLPPVVTKPPNASVVTGQVFNYQVIANDPEGTVLTYSATNLPAGLNINSGTGLISGTVSAAAAVFTVNISVKDLQDLTSTTSFVLTVTNPNLPPVITTPPDANVISGQSFSYQVVANDPEGTSLVYSATNLPAGLSINSSTGLISGMVNASAGSNTVILTVTDQPGLTASTSFIIAVSNPNQPPVVTNPPNATVIQGQEFSYQVIANDPEGTTLSYSASNLPAGLSINSSSGLISGIVNDVAGDYTVALTVQDIQGLVVNTSFVIKVVNPNLPPVITQPDNQNALNNAVFTYQVIASDPEDGQVGLVFSATGLPAGLLINANSGLISGTVAASIGDYNVLLGVEDKEGLAGEGKSFTISVSNANQPPEIIQPEDQDAIKDETFSYQVQASDPEDGITGLVYSANGLPAGLSISSSTGLISGTVTAVEGNYSVTLDVTDQDNLGAVSKTFAIRVTIANQPPVITDTDDVIMTRNQSSSYQIVANDPEDGQNALVYSASGLPAGLTVSSSSGLISGIVTATAGDYLVTLDAQDKEGLSATDVILKITVLDDNQPPEITNPGSQTVVAGDEFSLQILAVDPEQDNISFSATGLPQGLTINGAGAISGTPENSSGDYSVVVTATDSNGADGQATFVIKVNNRPAIISAPNNITLFAGEMLSYQVVATDADDGSSLNYSLSEPSLGLSIDSDGLISGFVTNEVGSYTVVLTVTDDTGLSSTANLEITVVEQPAATMSTDSLPLNESLRIQGTKINKNLLTVFPNPAYNEFSLNFYVEERGEWKFALYSINGNTIQLPKHNLEKGVATVRFDLTSYNLKPGVYFLLITNGLNQKKTGKLIINGFR